MGCGAKVFLAILWGSGVCLLLVILLFCIHREKIHAEHGSPSGSYLLKVRSSRKAIYPLFMEVQIHFDFYRKDGSFLGTRDVDSRDMLEDVDQAVKTITWDSDEARVVADPGFLAPYHVTVPHPR